MDGSVSGKASGPTKNLDLFFLKLKVGPPMARVDKVTFVEIHESLSEGFHCLDTGH